MNIETFNRIKSEYGNHSSFAVWNPDNLNDVSVIEKSLESLHGNIIFVGVNASNPVDCFKNFHMRRRGGRDIWLQEAFNSGIFYGAYMTDFFKDDFSKKSSGVDKSLSRVEDGVKKLKDEISILGTNPIFVRFGKDPKSELEKFFPKKRIFTLPHYAKPGITKEVFLSSVEKIEQAIKNQNAQN